MPSDLPFEKIVELHYASLYRFAFTLTRQEEEASDLTQETFCIWAEKGHQLRDRTKAKSWLFTTLHREFLARQKKFIRLPQVDWEENTADLPEAGPLPFERADYSTIVRSLAKIDEPFQAAVALFYLEDYTHQEMADILKVPLGTIKSRISRGIAQLQRLMLDRNHPRAGKELCG